MLAQRELILKMLKLTTMIYTKRRETIVLRMQPINSLSDDAKVSLTRPLSIHKMSMIAKRNLHV